MSTNNSPTLVNVRGSVETQNDVYMTLVVLFWLPSIFVFLVREVDIKLTAAFPRAEPLSPPWHDAPKEHVCKEVVQRIPIRGKNITACFQFGCFDSLSTSHVWQELTAPSQTHGANPTH
eukprot:3035141-Amphidinium_carterae.1